MRWLYFSISALHTGYESVSPLKSLETGSNGLKSSLRPFTESAWRTKILIPITLHNLPPLASSDLNFVLNLRLKNMLMKIEA